MKSEFDGPLEEIVEDLQLNSDFVIHQVVISHEKIPNEYHLDLGNVVDAPACEVDGSLSVVLSLFFLATQPICGSYRARWTICAFSFQISSRKTDASSSSH